MEFQERHLDERYNWGYTNPVKTAISIPDDVFEQAELLAKEMGFSRSELYSKAVAAYLASWRNEDITKALNEVYDQEPATLDPVLAEMQIHSLPDEEW